MLTAIVTVKQYLNEASTFDDKTNSKNLQNTEEKKSLTKT